MGAARPLLSFASLIVLGGGIVMAFFVILSGSTISSPEQYIYFLQADTTGIENPGKRMPDPARWTFFAICGVGQHGHNADCRSPTAALPFDPPRNFQTTQGTMPASFIGTHHYYYLSRFAFAFYLIAIFFAVVSFFLSGLALCTRLGAYLAGMNVAIACLFQGLAAALITAWSIQGRNAFRRNGHRSQVGTYAYAFTWTAFVCYFICTVLFCLGGRAGSDRSSKKSSGYFGRQKSTRSRGSFRDSDSARRVKDEYGSEPMSP